MYCVDWLGPVLLRRAGVVVPLPIKKALALLMLLARDGATSRERIVALLWPALDESTARRNLRRELARLRDAGAEALLRAEGDLLAIAPDTEIAAQSFEVLHTEQPDDALALWRGPPADGLYLEDAPQWEAWLVHERRRLEAMRAQALALSAARHEAAGAPAIALQRVRSLLVDDPLRERLHVDAMRLLDRLGQREAALAQYATCARWLSDELGLEPMTQTQALAAALRGQGVALAAARATPQSLVPERLPFVGREREVAWLERGWHSGKPLLIEGEGGIGKSRLAIDFAAAHGPCVLAHCRPGDADLPLASIARALRALAGPDPAVSGLPQWATDELARLLPELGSAPPPMRSEDERARFGQACALAWQSWADGNFDAVIIDDWHFADASSQALLMQVSSGVPRVRLLLVYRPELTRDAAALLQRERQAGALHLRLQPLAPAAIQSLLLQLSGRQAPRLSALLAQATEGNPFYVFESLRHLAERGLLRAGTDGTWQIPFDDRAASYRDLPMPDSVRNAVLARVERLGERTRRVLQAAALAGEPFGAALLAPACALSEVETALALEDALDARLLREGAGAGGDPSGETRTSADEPVGDRAGLYFAHDLVQQALVSALDAARRRAVHRRLALGAAAAGAPPARIAAHHEAGGEAPRAVPWRRRAGDEALRLHALDEAIVQWRQALADGATPDEAMAIGMALMRVLETRDQMDEALAQADDVLRWAQLEARDAPRRCEALIAVAALRARRDRPVEALALLDTLAATTDVRLRALALQARSDALRGLGRNDEARELAREALALGGLIADERGNLLDSLILAEAHSGHFQQALQYIEQSLALGHAIGDRVGVARALGRRGVMLTQLGDPGAESALSEAADMAGRLGLRGYQRNMLFNLCALHSAQSRPEAVLRVARECWELPPPMPLDPHRVMVRLAFVEAHVALGDLGPARSWLVAAIDDAVAVNHLFALASAILTGAELLALLGESERLPPLLAALEVPEADEAAAGTAEMWLVLAECALQAGESAAARAYRLRLADVEANESERVRLRATIVDAALRLADGAPTAALERLPDDTAPGLNDELRWRALAVRLRGEAALGGCTPATLAAAEAALTRQGVHALAALLLHQALLEVAATPARRLAWSQRIDSLASSLNELPDCRAGFLQRWPDAGA